MSCHCSSILLLVGLAIGAVAPVAAQGDRGDSRIRVLAAAQVVADVAGSGVSVSVPLAAIHVEKEGSLECAGVELWRAEWVMTSGSMTYLLAVIDSAVLRLAGFQETDLNEFARLLPSNPRGTTCNQGLVLALLAESESWDRWTDPGDSDSQDHFEVQALRRSESGFEPDTSWTTATGLQVVRKTVLTHVGRRLESGWRASMYAFVFDERGVLVAWRRLMRTDLNVPHDS